MPLISIVVATYNRPDLLQRLLEGLAKQSVPREDYEVVVVDDGSREDATPVAMAFAGRLQVSVLRQRNSGVAVARNRGVDRARGRIIAFLDDDMLVAEDFVARHLEAHGGADDRVVMGEILPDPRLAEMPLFERFHAHQLAASAERYAKAGTFRGAEAYTGNLSMPRALFLRIGGFDPSFFIEDVELGVRLEQAGATFVFSREAATVHASDHTSLEKWMARSALEGRDWVRLARKHPGSRSATPWRYFSKANPLSRAFYALAVLVPDVAPALARLIFHGAAGTDARGLERLSVSAMTLLYGVEYFRGVRLESGTLGAALRGYLASREPQRSVFG